MRLRPVPDSPPRALGLVRVSALMDRSEDDLLSPDIQRAAITDHCARRGYELTGWVEGIDESGSRRKSAWWAKLDEAVGQVEAGTADVLVVWRFSRTARQRLKWAVAIDRVEVAGGLLESATEPLDTSTASGRLARGMLAEFASYEAETISSAWRETHARRTGKGLPANGKPRFGYRVLDGVHRPHGAEAGVLAEMYRRYIAGESVYSLTLWLNEHGWTTTPGYSKHGPGPWTQTTLRRVLDAGFGAGLITVHGESVRGIHEPVIDGATWEAYLAARDSRRVHRRSERSKYLLSGMVYCMAELPDGSACGSRTGGGQFGWQGVPKFRCTAAATQRRHPGGYVEMHVVEREVWAWVERLAGDVEASADAALAQQARRARRLQDADMLDREVLAADKALVRLEANRARDHEVPETVWAQARAELLAQRTGAERRARIARAEAMAGEPARIAADLARDRDEWPFEQLRGTLRQLISRIEFTPGRPRATVRVIGTFEAG